MTIYIPPQLKRLLFFLVIFIALFIVADRMLTPETYGDLGNYRAASLIDNEAYEPVYAGQESCRDCHSDVAEQIDTDMHSQISCETCHNAAYAHTQDPFSGSVLKPEGRDFCGRCHSLNAARPQEVISQIDLAAHNTDFTCTECHNHHQPWEIAD